MCADLFIFTPLLILLKYHYYYSGILYSIIIFYTSNNDFSSLLFPSSLHVILCVCTSQVESLIILNGFHGQVFQTAFQPLVRFPFIGDMVAVYVL